MTPTLSYRCQHCQNSWSYTPSPRVGQEPLINLEKECRKCKNLVSPENEDGAEDFPRLPSKPDASPPCFVYDDPPTPEPMVYRFTCFNGSQSPGFAVAVADSKEEAIDRIVFKWSYNHTIALQRNRKVDAVYEEIKGHLKANSPESFAQALMAAKNWTCDDYEKYLGPRPDDYLGNWRIHQPKSAHEFCRLIKSELEVAPLKVYPLNDCAMYCGGL